jgi:uncharacterized protein YueI
LKKTTVDEVLQQGIYGTLETKPDERRKFLGTLRERIVVALTKRQVAETNVYPQVEKQMKERPQSHLFLNGNLSYETLSKYVKLATKYKIEHTLVTNKEHDSEIGLVLAMDHAIDLEDIYITNKEPQPGQSEIKKNKGFFANLFKRK